MVRSPVDQNAYEGARSPRRPESVTASSSGARPAMTWPLASWRPFALARPIAATATRERSIPLWALGGRDAAARSGPIASGETRCVVKRSYSALTENCSGPRLRAFKPSVPSCSPACVFASVLHVASPRALR